MNTCRGFFIRFFVLTLLIHLLYSGPARSETLDYCWNGACFASLTEAESAMRGNFGATGPYLEQYRTSTSFWSNLPYTNHYAVDIQPLEFHAPYAFWSWQPNDRCANNYPTPDHFDKCNSLAGAAAKADEYHLTQPNVCFAKTTPDGGGYLQYPAGGAATSGSRDWFAQNWGVSSGRVTIRQFQNPSTLETRFDSEDCAITHLNTAYTITVLEYGLCPLGLFDDYDNRSPVSGNARKQYPYECGNQAQSTIEVKKALSNASCSASEGNPCDPLTGNKRLRATDFQHDSLPVERSYHSLKMLQWKGDVGRGWNHNYDARVVSDGGVVMAQLPDGSISHFDEAPDGATYVSDQLPNVLLYLTGNSGAELHYENGDVWFFEGETGSYGLFLTARQSAADAGRSVTILRDDFRRVSEVIDASGRSLQFLWEDDYLVSIVRPDGEAILYVYEDAGLTDRQRLVQVGYPDGATVGYEYADARHPYHVTAVVDELGNTFASYAYDETGKVSLSEHAGGAGRVTLSYNGLETTVTTPSGDSRVYHGATFGGYYGKQFPSHDGVTDGEGATSVNWRSGQPRRKAAQTDREGNETRYQYDALSRSTTTTRAWGTAQQTQSMQVWDSDHNRVAERHEPGQVTLYTFNDRAQLLTKTVRDTVTQAERRWTYSYFEAPALAPLIGRLQSVDGPRTDVADITTYEYYASDHPGGDYLIGDRKAVVNALGHRAEYLKYDANGRPLEVLDANNVLTVLTYHLRGWISSRTTDGKTTQFDHDAAGNLTRVTQPDGSFIDYEYDAAHRLTAMADNFDNRLEYTLDAAGNRTAEKTYDDLGSLRRQLSRVYDQLNRLDKLIDGNNDQTDYGYDNNGNRSSALDANQNTTRFEYDPLDRLSKTIDAILGETLMDYDERDNLVAVTDPLGNVTQYTYDGLDNQIRLESPDTGTTSYEYDDAGNRTAATDGRGIRVEHRYDALNRLTAITYPDSSLDVTFTYDAGSNGKGRLTTMSDAVGTVDYGYDARGNLISESRTINGALYVTSYAYNAADRLTRITYPSGMEIDYALDAAGRSTAVDQTVGAVTATLAGNIQYEPFGPVSAFTYGNGLSYTASYDLDFELDQLQSGSGLDWLLGYDPVGNILNIADRADSRYNQAFTYDDLYRLKTAQGNYPDETFEYDANGNRTRYQNTVVDDPYTYQPQSNRLATQNGWTFSRDAAGNRTAKLGAGGYGQLYSYTDHNRLAQTVVRDGGGDTVVGDYAYDGRGQRVKKTAAGTTVHYVYGPSGELLGEYADGVAEDYREYVYLNGQPLAVHSKREETVTPPPIELILDNGDPGTSSTGSWQTKTGSQDYGADYRYANQSTNRTYRWTATPPGSTYDVYAWWVAKNNQSANVSYTIRYGSGETDTVSKSHQTSGGQWQLLGSYYSTDGQDYVEVSSTSNKFVADAIRWVHTPYPSVVLTESTNFIHVDHLGTPRRVTDETQTVVWRWDSAPFGELAPDEDPDGDASSFTLNLRFPGQYFDMESGLHYNYFRTYDPEIGRYVESDPIGLSGGLNTFGYVIGNPLRFIDPAGLEIRGSWIDLPTLVDYDIDFERITLGERFDLRGFPPGLSFAYLLYSYTGTVQGVVYCIDDDACNPKRWMISPKYDFGGEFQYRIWLTPLKNPWGATLTITNAGIEATEIAELLYEEWYFAAEALKNKGPTALCKASTPPNQELF